MHFLKYLPFVVLPAVMATHTPKDRDADVALVLQDIGDISQAVAALNSSVVAYQGDLHDALTIQHQSTDVSDAVEQTTADANNAPPFNDEESASIGIAVLNLQPDIIQLLDNLEDKKETFGHLGSIVRHTLVEQRAQTVDLGDAITAKLTPDFAAVAPGVIKQITDKFDEAIAVYSS